MNVNAIVRARDTGGAGGAQAAAQTSIVHQYLRKYCHWGSGTLGDSARQDAETSPPSAMRDIRTVRNNTGTRQHHPPRRRAQGDGAGGRSLGGPQPASSAEYLYIQSPCASGKLP